MEHCDLTDLDRVVVLLLCMPERMELFLSAGSSTNTFLFSGLLYKFDTTCLRPLPDQSASLVTGL